MIKQNLSIKTGDIFKLGEHLLVCGDCKNQDLVNKVLVDKKIKLLLTDPPFACSYVESKTDMGLNLSVGKNIVGDQIQTDDQYKKFVIDWLNPLITYLDDKNSFYLFNSDRMSLPLLQALNETGLTFSQLLIWIKSQSVIGRKDYNPQHEVIFYGWYKKHEFLKSKDKSVLFHPKPASNKLHPTMKPISILRRLILNSTNIGDYIYDPFAGSGSTLIAAEHTQRKSINFEIDPDYCNTIISRYEKLTGLRATLYA